MAPEISMDDGLVTLAIDVGATRTRIAVVSRGRIEARVALETSALAGHARGVADGLIPAVREFLAYAGRPRLLGGGIALAAAVDAHGSVLEARRFGIPAGPLVRDAVAATIDAPVAVDNDANLAALAEQRYGAVRGHRTAVVLTLGTNIGAGLIIEGALYRGAHGAAGEAGLLLVPAGANGEHHGRRRVVGGGRFGQTPSGAPDGYAWIEELVGGGALAALADGRRVVSSGGPDDPAGRELVDRAVEGWAFVIADLAAVLDPEVVVLTGGLAADAAHLITRLQRRVAELVARPPEVLLGMVGPDAELLGADLLVRAALAAEAAHDARAGLSAQTIGG